MVISLVQLDVADKKEIALGLARGKPHPILCGVVVASTPPSEFPSHPRL